MKQRAKRLMALMLTASMAAGTMAVPAAAADPYAQAADAAADPYAQAAGAAADPYAQAADAAADPYAQAAGAAADPYAQAADAAADPYAQAAGAAADPYAQAADAAADPYAQAADAAADPYAQAADAAADPYAQAADAAAEDTTEAAPSADAKYTVTTTEDGWVKVENEGGDTLGYSETSGVKLIEEEGFAFKDMNQNGALDPYEDWRLTTEERAADLAGQMQGAEMAAVLTHGGWGDFTTEPLAADDTSYTYLMAGGRGGVTRNISEGGGAHAKWTNAIQTVAESSFYGIPAMISIDPANISGLVETLSLASTMDPELAAEIGNETAKEYRAAGVSALLGPQVDIASPIMSRAGGTYGEDPQLTLDIATAYVNAMQSTYDESGEDLGWGSESVYCFTKHFGGAGSTEGGRDDHANGGRYATFPGNNLEAHLITYFDGVFNLPGLTKSSGIMTQYAIDVDAEGNPIGGEWAGAYNPYLNNMLTEGGYDSLKITDWGVFQFAGVWGAEGLEEADRIATAWENGMNLLGGYSDTEKAVEAYNILVERDGQEAADELMREKAGNYIETMMNLEMFEQPYSDSAYADSIITTGASSDFALDTQRQSVVMIKNDGTISADGAVSEKPTVYVPYVYNSGWSTSWMRGTTEGTPSWTPGMDLEVLGKYFNVVTDTLGEATGEADADGNATYTKEDLTRATAEEIAACDYVLAGMSGAYVTSYNSLATGAFGGEPVAEGTEDVWYPANLQYGEYVADTAREVSISGKVAEDGTKENRSYKGVAAHEVANYGDLEALQYAAEAAGDVPVIVSMKMDRGMVWSEVEPLADVILVNYNKQREDVTAEVILGQTEPNGLLVFQQPASMETVEAQLEDVPRDMECYADAAGNAYDFAFGLNWAGKIDDERTAKYSADPLTTIQNFDYAAYAEANK
ncbi:MAG: glycoside hydrolase family 3 N-terminal domain-containing protein [Lachnospiraceae bacterium]|nr:glycoside hydrolase family 3 N-terminal domain-containing protein [Lachnospiraceae bacterium]MDD3796807.1 glycoside hydrolase family 3 N-terminal domain-containing protein [Lachnospiraceae bacterium]